MLLRPISQEKLRALAGTFSKAKPEKVNYLSLSTVKIPFAEVIHPCMDELGGDLDLDFRPAPAPVASRNLGIVEFCPFGIVLRKR